MFSFFKRSNTVSSNSAKKADDDDSDDGKSNQSDDIEASYDTDVEIAGTRGWPEDATVLLYHKIQGLICCGTEGGAVYCFGDGFQFVRSCLTDEPNEVVSIVSLFSNKILVAFSDNSIVVMELPSLEIIDLLPPNWLHSSEGDLTAIYCDLPTEKNFVYIGTTEGNLHVLDVMEASIRICDFKLTLSDFGLSGNEFSISDIHSCPKDERYLAISFDGSSDDQGAIAFYDLVKGKLHKLFKTNAITSLNWHNLGDVVYAGTRTGEVLFINFEKLTLSTIWNASSELLDGNDDDYDNPVVIRRVSWLSAQHGYPEGCLFVLLSTNSSDNDNLQNVIIGLYPSNPNTLGDLTTIFSLPPIPYEKITSFRIVPTYEKAQSENPGSSLTPALLMLTQKVNPANTVGISFTRQVRILRCPTSPTSEWALEIGTLPDPRKAIEVQPGKADISVVRGSIPNFSNPISLGKALLSSILQNGDKIVNTAAIASVPKITSQPSSSSHANDDDDVILSKRASRRISNRDFFSLNHAITLSDFETQIATMDTWEMVLVNGEHEEKSQILRPQDIVFVGNNDGTIIAYGVSRSHNEREKGKGNIWLPLKALRCSSTSITVISPDENSGLLLVGDEEGVITLFEAYDESTKVGTSELMKRYYDKVSIDAEELSNDLDNVPSIDDFPESQTLKDLQYYDYYQFNDTRDVHRCKLPGGGSITALSVLGPFLTIFAGTQEGHVYFCTDLKAGIYGKIEKIESTGACGAVRAFQLGYYYDHHSLVVAVYVFFNSGHVVVIGLQSMTVLAYNIAFKAGSSVNLLEEFLVNYIDTFTSSLAVAKKPSLYIHLYMIAKARKLLATKSSTGSFDSSSPNLHPPSSPVPIPEVPDQPKNSRRSFFSMTLTKSSAPATSITSDKEKVEEAPKKDPLTFTFLPGDIPTKLVMIISKNLVVFNLERFIQVKKKLDSVASVATAIGAVLVKAISTKPIIASSLYTFIDQIEGDSSYNSDIVLSCVDSEGLMRLVSLKANKAVHHTNLLEGLTSSAPNLYNGSILSNGSCYLLAKGTMIFTPSLIFQDKSLSTDLPERAYPECKPVDKSLSLLHGREQLLAQLKATIKKRRSSVINLSAAPTDLYKIFQKTKDQGSPMRNTQGKSNPKEELFGSNAETEEDSSLHKAKQTTTRTNAELHQLKESFAERGEKINRIALKMDDFKQSAAEFRQAAAAQKAKLQKKNNRWGLF